MNVIANLANGIDIQTDSGWEELLKGIDSMIDSVFNSK